MGVDLIGDDSVPFTCCPLARRLGMPGKSWYLPNCVSRLNAKLALSVNNRGGAVCSNLDGPGDCRAGWVGRTEIEVVSLMCGI